MNDMADDIEQASNILQLESDVSDSDTILVTDELIMSQLDTAGVCDTETDKTRKQDQAPDQTLDTTAVEKGKDIIEIVIDIDTIPVTEEMSRSQLDTTSVSDKETDKTRKQDYALEQNLDTTALEIWKDTIEIKKVTVLLHKLSKEEIDEATKAKNTVIITKPPCPSYRRAKDIHTPVILHKDTSGQHPRFTFSTFKLARKHKHKYKFHCAVPGCGKVFNLVKYWNSHHLFRHRSVRYRCRICRRWLQTPNRLRDHI